MQLVVAEAPELHDVGCVGVLGKILEAITLEILDDTRLARGGVGLDQLARNRIAELREPAAFGPVALEGAAHVVAGLLEETPALEGVGAFFEEQGRA